MELQGFVQPPDPLLQVPDGVRLGGQGLFPFLAFLPALEGVSQLLSLLEGFQGGGSGFLGLGCLGFQVFGLLLLFLEPLFQGGRAVGAGTFQEQLIFLPAFLVLLFQDFGPGIQGIFQGTVLAGLEQGFQDGLPLLGISHQEPAEFSLGQHHQLAELPGLEAQELFHRPGHGAVGGAQDFPFSLRQDLHQGSPRRHRPGPFAPLFVQHLFRGPGHFVGTVLVPEGEPDFRLPVRGGVVAAQGPVVPEIPAGGAVQGKGDGIQDGGLAAAGGAGDQEKPVLPQPGEINGFLPGVGAEGVHYKFQGTHQAFLPSWLTSSAIWWNRAFSPSVRSRPWTSRKKAWNRSSVESPFRWAVAVSSFSRGWSRS